MALLPLSPYSAGLTNPWWKPARWSATAMYPANSGEDRLVPPIRYSPYLTEPSGNVCVSPTSIPEFGSPSIEMSGTTRPTPPYRPASRAGTTLRW